MKRKKSLMAIAGVMVAILLVLGYLHSQVRTTPAGKPSMPLTQSDHQVRIDGLRFFSIQEGRQVMSIEAASFIIEKKKIGFFRFALAHTARIVNGRLVIFLEPGGKGKTYKSLTDLHAPSQEFQDGNNPVRFPVKTIFVG